MSETTKEQKKERRNDVTEIDIGEFCDFFIGDIKCHRNYNADVL